MARWLLPLVAVLALCGRAVTAYAAAGWVGRTACCCPDPAHCKCKTPCNGGKSDVMKRCVVDAKLVAPHLAPSVVVEAPPIARAYVMRAIVQVAVPALVSLLPVPPEPPPI